MKIVQKTGSPRLYGSLFAVALFATLPFGFASAQDTGTVVLASYGSVWQEALEKALKPFEAENKVRVRFTAGSSADNVARAIAARNKPEVDVVMGEEMTFGQGVAAGVYEKLDPAIVTNLKNIVPEAKMGAEGVGVVMQAIGFFYNTEEFKKQGWAEPSSWNDLLDKKFCHRVGWSHPSVSFTYYALMMIGGGGADDILKGAEKVAAMKDCIDTIDPNAAKTVEKAQLGEYILGIMAHQLTLTLAKKGAPLKHVDPKEGSVLQFSSAAVTKNAPNPKMAQLLINEMLSERVQKVLVEAFSASPVNPAVKVSAELAAAGAPDPSHMKKYIGIPTEAILKNRNRYLQEATRIMSR
jgi:putative spermidine/putrescine transport system substrate-binding protein